MKQMKTRILFIAITICAVTYANAQEKLKINTSKSELKWSGDYTFYFGGHYGTINFKDGYFMKTNEVITGGEFVIDMNTIINTDIENAEGNESLVNHLKDPDFFDVKKFPIATLVITKVIYHDQKSMQIDANLTIKEITKPIRFQAEVDYAKKQMTTKFKIDRKLWNVNYDSKMRDGAISDAIGFEVKLSL